MFARLTEVSGQWSVVSGQWSAVSEIRLVRYAHSRQPSDVSRLDNGGDRGRGRVTDKVVITHSVYIIKAEICI